MAQDLEQLFADKTLIRPTDRHPNFVHLIQAIATICGVPDLSLGPQANNLARQIGIHDKIVFVLLDGLGMNLINRLPSDCFLRSSLKGPLNATCPSTTAAALTTVSTALYPAQHGVCGWFTHLPELEMTVMMLPFAERVTKQPLGLRGLHPSDILPPTLVPRMTHRPLTLVPAYIANTPYNQYSRGNTEGQGYGSLADGIDRVIAAVTTSNTPQYVHLYLHDIDTLCHHVGVHHDSVGSLIMGIDAELSRLADALAGKARIIVTADHGLIDVPPTDQLHVFSGDPLLDTLVVPPSGDARMPVFHLRPGERDNFVNLFHKRYDRDLVLVDIDEAERLELFGPGKIPLPQRRHFGDFLGIPKRAATLEFRPPGKPANELYLALHGGLSPQEMHIPLCMA